MASDTHPSIITQVTPDSERAKLEAELQNSANVDVNQPDVRFNENSAAETVFSPTPKAVENPTVNNASKKAATGGSANQSTAATSDGKQAQPSGKIKSLFCCFRLCKKPNKQRSTSDRYAKTNNGAKQQASASGGSQVDGSMHPNGAQPSGAAGGDQQGDASRQRGAGVPANGATSFGGPQMVSGMITGGPFLLPPLLPGEPVKRCLVIDLDETLVHSSFKPVDNPDLTVDVEIDGQVHQVYVLKRPFVEEFLTRVGQLFECVLFTASLAKYADPVTNWLDTNEPKVFSARLFRDACVLHKGNYVKDLSRLGRPLDSAIIIDNSPASYSFHPQNAVPVKTWFDDPSDRELLDLIPLFERLATCPDIYSVLAQYHAERQAQQAHELALLRSLSLPLGYTAALVASQPQSHQYAAAHAQLPAYQYQYQQVATTATANDPPLPDYASLQPTNSNFPVTQVTCEQQLPLVEVLPAAVPTPTAAPAPEAPAAVVNEAQVSANTSNSNSKSNSIRRHSGSGAPSRSSSSTGRSTPVCALETPAAHAAGQESANEDEDRSLFSPLPVPPLFITPPTPRLGEGGGTSHSASVSHSHSPTSSSAAEAALASSDSDAETSPIAMQKHSGRSVSQAGSHSAINNNGNGKPQVNVDASASNDGSML